VPTTISKQRGSKKGGDSLGNTNCERQFPGVRGGPFVELGDRIQLKRDLGRSGLKCGMEGKVVKRRGLGMLQIEFEDGKSYAVHIFECVLLKNREYCKGWKE